MPKLQGKQTLGRYLDGRVTAVLGTHTHVTTADEMILPKKTAYHSDVGMCGSHESILGRSISNVIEASTTMIPKPFTFPIKMFNFMERLLKQIQKD